MAQQEISSSQWACPACTVVQSIYNPFCELCGTNMDQQRANDLNQEQEETISQLMDMGLERDDIMRQLATYKLFEVQRETEQNLIEQQQICDSNQVHRKHNSFYWNFDHITAVNRFKNAEENVCIESHKFTYEDCVFYLVCAPNGLPLQHVPKGECILWLAIDTLPDDIKAIHITFTFRCNAIKYTDSHTCRRMGLIKTSGCSSSQAITTFSKFQDYQNLSQWTFELDIVIHQMYQELPDETWKCNVCTFTNLVYGRCHVCGAKQGAEPPKPQVTVKRRYYCPKMATVKQFEDLMTDCMLKFVRSPEYNAVIRWLVEIWNNIRDKAFPVVNCSDILRRLKKEQYVQMFEALLELSGFEKNECKWVFTANCIDKVTYLNAFWSLMLSKCDITDEDKTPWDLDEKKEPMNGDPNNNEYEEKIQNNILPVHVHERPQTAIAGTLDLDVKQECIASDVLCENSNTKAEHKCELAQCEQWMRIKHILKKYQIFIEYKQFDIFHGIATLHDVYKEINKSNYSDVHLLNDFNHLNACHSDEFELIHNLLLEECNHKPCNVSSCLMLKRNHRNRGSRKQSTHDYKQMYFDDHDRCVAQQQLLDRIHSYYFHSFDIGHKMKQKEKEQIVSETDAKTLIHKPKQYVSGSAEPSNKFIVNIDEVQNKYSYGWRYYYWTYFKNNVMTNDPTKRTAWRFAANIDPNTGNGARLCDWYIEPKFLNLKDELLHNAICTIGSHKWGSLMHKGMCHQKTERCRAMRCIRSDTAKYYDMKCNTPFAITHVLSMMVYCNMDGLSAKFTQTFRFLHLKESCEHLKKRHSNYCWMGRYLRECVECFGWKRQGSEDLSLYHGISTCLTFDSLNAFMKGPTSTTRDQYVASTFADQRGMMLKVDIDTEYWQIHWHDGHETSRTITNISCFECNWLSEYPAEEEVFFIGGIYQFTINTITEVSIGKAYCLELKGIKQMTCFMNNGLAHCDAIYVPRRKDEKLVKSLLCHQIWRCCPMDKNADEWKAGDAYIKDIMHNHCQHIINIMFPCPCPIKSEVHNALLLDTNGWIKLDLLMKLFPNTRGITCWALNAYLEYINAAVIMESLLMFLMDHKDTKLEEITVYSIEPQVDSMMGVIYSYKECLWNKHLWVVYFMDDYDYDNACEIVLILFRNMKKSRTII
eukprot:53597_1